MGIAVAETKFAKAVDAAMRAFVNFIDPRLVGTAAYGAAQENRPEAVRLLHEMRADLGKRATDKIGGTPAIRASPIRIEPRVRPLQQRRSRDYRTAGNVRQEDYRTSMQR